LFTQACPRTTRNVTIDMLSQDSPPPTATLLQSNFSSQDPTSRAAIAQLGECQTEDLKPGLGTFPLFHHLSRQALPDQVNEVPTCDTPTPAILVWLLGPLNRSDPTPASPDILLRRLHCSRLVEACEAIEPIRYVRNRPAVKQGQDLCL